MLWGDGKRALIDIADLYQSICDGIQEAVPYQSLNESFAFNGSAVEPWSYGVRSKLAQALYKAVETEREIRAKVRALLDRWEK